MPEYLVIRLCDEPQATEWLLVDSHGSRHSQVSTGTLAQVASDINDRAVIVLVPAVDVLTTNAHMPVRSAAKIRAALPFALEEDLAEDVSELHFASGARNGDDKLEVSIVATDKMDAWLSRLRAAGIEATIVAAENHGLARIPGTLSVLIDGETIMYNDGAHEQFAMQNISPSDILALAGQLGEPQDADDKSGHVIVFCSAEKEQLLSHEWIALRHELHSVDVNLLPEGALPKLAITLASGHGVNLLQGKYGKKTEYSVALKPWKVAAMLLVAMIFIGTASKGLDYVQQRQELTQLKSQFVAEYQQLRPGDSREIADPKSLLDSIRRGMGTAAGPQVFLPSLAELSTAIAANASVSIEAVSYRAGVIDLRLLAPDVPTLDNIQKLVSASGRFSATIQSTDQVADKINGRIQIRESSQ